MDRDGVEVDEHTEKHNKKERGALSSVNSKLIINSLS